MNAIIMRFALNVVVLFQLGPALSDSIRVEHAVNVAVRTERGVIIMLCKWRAMLCPVHLPICKTGMNGE